MNVIVWLFNVVDTLKDVKQHKLHRNIEFGHFKDLLYPYTSLESD